MNDYPNPFDPEHQLKAPAKFDILDVVTEILGMPKMKPREPVIERRDLSHAGHLRRTAFRFEQQGETATARLFRNAAWILEHPGARVDHMPEDK